MTKRILLLALLVLCVGAGTASAAPRMWVGFQDDPSFRFREQRQANLDDARRAGATVIRATVNWYQAAPERPARAANPFDPAYRLEDIDDLVRSAQQRGIEVMLTIWGTPAWANGGGKPNRPPKRAADLGNFARALAARYSGSYPGYPFVRFFTIWNEPNLELFLAPQFDARGRSVAPRTYARMFRSAYLGIKKASPRAQVGIGETSARGRDKPLPAALHARQQDTHSPGKFAELVAKADRRLRFDAWAHHPYPTTPSMKPTQKVRWPNVTLASLTQFEKSLDRWFKRKNLPVWITEYSHITRPPYSKGVSYRTQASYARQALSIARKDPRVEAFVWFVFRDDASNPWKSGLETTSGAPKPAFSTFAALARVLDARDAIVRVKAGAGRTVRVSALEIAARSGSGALVGANTRLFDGDDAREPLSIAQPQLVVELDGWVVIPIDSALVAGRTYRLHVDLEDKHGNRVARTLTVVATK